MALSAAAAGQRAEADRPRRRRGRLRGVQASPARCRPATSSSLASGSSRARAAPRGARAARSRRALSLGGRDGAGLLCVPRRQRPRAGRGGRALPNAGPGSCTDASRDAAAIGAGARAGGSALYLLHADRSATCPGARGGGGTRAREHGRRPPPSSPTASASTPTCLPAESAEKEGPSRTRRAPAACARPSATPGRCAEWSVIAELARRVSTSASSRARWPPPSWSGPCPSPG
jgi:hypothetical protein